MRFSWPWEPSRGDYLNGVSQVILSNGMFQTEEHENKHSRASRGKVSMRTELAQLLSRIIRSRLIGVS